MMLRLLGGTALPQTFALFVTASAALHVGVAASWAWLSPVGESLQAKTVAALAEPQAALQVRTITPRPAAVLRAVPVQVPTDAAPPATSVTRAPRATAPAVLEPATEPESVFRGWSRHHFDVSEVDIAAMPQPDWQVDIELLMAGGITQLNFEVLISETGQLERCEVLQVEPPTAVVQDDFLAHTLAAHLCTTTATPALRAGVAVPSVRRIELLLAQ